MLSLSLRPKVDKIEWNLAISSVVRAVFINLFGVADPPIALKKIRGTPTFQGYLTISNHGSVGQKILGDKS